MRLKQFRGDSQFSTWLHRLVVNTCRDAAERRQVRVHEPLAEDLSTGPDDDPVRAAGMSELRRELCASLVGVSPQQAQVVLLKDALGYSFEEIAEASACRWARPSVTLIAGATACASSLEEREVA